MEAAKKEFNKRAFVSIGMFATLSLLPVSGIMNHYMQFEQLTMYRHFWMAVHNMTATLFTVFAVLHLMYNWRPLLRHIGKVTSIRINKEALAAVGVIVLIVGLFASHAFHLRP